MLARVYSGATQGVDAIEIEIEVNAASHGDPSITLVGLPDAAVRESKDRVVTAISNSGYRWPRTRTTINLAPADVKKEGPSFDLPIAIGMIAVTNNEQIPRLDRCVVAGELALNGEVRSIRGALPLAIEARRKGRKALIVPKANVREAAVVEGIEVYGVATLREAYEFLTRAKELEPAPPMADDFLAAIGHDDLDFAEVRGQHQVKRAIEVAVAGNHAIFKMGPIYECCAF